MCIVFHIDLTCISSHLFIYSILLQQELVRKAGMRAVRQACGEKFEDVEAFLKSESFPVVSVCDGINVYTPGFCSFRDVFT